MSERDEIAMFGCTEATLKESVEESITFRFSGAAMVATSYMSDAQEEIERGNVESARQIINCAKYIVVSYLTEPERA